MATTQIVSCDRCGTSHTSLKPTDGAPPAGKPATWFQIVHTLRGSQAAEGAPNAEPLGSSQLCSLECVVAERLAEDPAALLDRFASKLTTMPEHTPLLFETRVITTFLPPGVTTPGRASDEPH